MTRAVRLALVPVSLLVSLLFLAGAVGIEVSGPHGGMGIGADTAMRFHEIPPRSVLVDSLCQSSGCHPVDPHGKEGTSAAFLNFHGEFTDCRVCHGKPGEGYRAERKDSPGRWALKSASPVVTPDPHVRRESPTPCRDCHSEAGKSLLRSRGLEEFPGGFDNPIALRMIEERKNRWLPAGLR